MVDGAPPLQALPPVLMTSDPGSFARATIVDRKPQIIRRVVADHAYPAEVVSALDAFAHEIASSVIQPPMASAEDAEAGFWRDQWAQYAGRTWLELPWYFAETYFYRRMLEIVGYFDPGRWHAHDPFGPQKRVQEAEAIDQVGRVWPKIVAEAGEARFVALLHASLWGNRADLSNFTVRERAVGNGPGDREYILIDHTDAVVRLLRSKRSPARVAFVNDNVGADSLFDLALSGFLLEQGWARHVTLHLKDRPFFVSDAMPADIVQMVDRLCSCSHVHLAALGRQLRDALTSGNLLLATDPFWSRSLCFEDLPEPLRAQLASNDLIFVKGDVNYRRLLGDRRWPHTTPLESISTRFPRPFVALRTLKGEIMAGLKPGEADALAAQDPEWLINGKRGIIHLVEPDRRDQHQASPSPYPVTKRP